jgi:3-deoxy-D-manno-octulosonic-acid transferase
MYVLMLIASVFHTKARKWIHGRSNQQLPTIPKNKRVVWFHCASLGEFDQGLPVMNALKLADPNVFLVVTFFSPSGMEFYNKRKHKVDLAVYLPLDTKQKAQQFIAQIHPELVYFVKYEFWYNHLKAAKRAGAKIYGVSSLFRPSHRFFKWYGGFFRRALALFDHFYTQDIRSAQLLASIGIDQSTVTGDTRFDRMIEVKNAGEENLGIAQFAASEKVLLLGSSWLVDEQMILPQLVEQFPTWKIIIAPHDISTHHIAQIQALLPEEGLVYSQPIKHESRFLIIDTIGQLTTAYRYATVAYVGGGFTGKLHNILEPAAFGVPVIFGPKYDRFPEAQLFVERGAAISVSDSASFFEALAYSENHVAGISQKQSRIFEENAGAVEKVLVSSFR